MTKTIFVRACLLLLACGLVRPSAAEDTDIFSPRDDLEPGVPTIIFMLDNTSNWSRNSVWPSGTQGQAEVKAISNVVEHLSKPVNIGVMEFTTKTNTSNNSGPDGAYVRFAVRPMDDSGSPSTANVELRNLLARMDGNVNSTVEKVANTQGIFANAMYEAWKYITGGNSWAGMDLSADYDNKNMGSGGNQVYPTYRDSPSLGDWAYVNAGGPKTDLAAGARYNPPPLSGCGNTYIVVIGNNRSGGGTGSFPNPRATDPSVTTLSTYNYSTAAGGYYQGTWARFLRNRPDLGTSGSNAAANGMVITYTVDAYDSSPNVDFSAMLEDMARQGGGERYKAGNETELEAALDTIVTKILAIDSVFAAVALPVSVNQRGSYLNQVYLGVFRPDAERAPNWVGNLKQYQIAAQTTLQGKVLYLADASTPPQAAAANNFISPTAKSFWTTGSTFWSSTYYANSQGRGGVSDSPDGDLVEKGAAAQKLRTTYATSQAARNVYTCIGSACDSDVLLSSMPFNTSLSTTDAPHSDFGAADDTERNLVINWVRGANNMLDDNPSGVATDVRGFIHGDVIHSRPVVINYNRSANDVYVFYGANDGLFRSIKGGQASGDGAEQWAFVPSEVFSKLKRLREHTPIISTSSTKPYFIDGSPTVYTTPLIVSGVPTNQVDKAYLYLTARRGGRFIYALDVSNPVAPRLLWKHSNSDTGFSELGQTWSELKVGRIRGQTDPVVIFGLGYDTVANDTAVVPAQATMGRGVMILNALTGAKIWSSDDANTSALRNGDNQFAIAAGVAHVDTDLDGYVDRIVAADTGGNLWRINVDYTDATTNPSNSPSNWTIDKMATLGATSGPNARKFLGEPDVVVASSSGIPVPYDSILIGSGDREQPFDMTITNRFYMIKDEHVKTYRYTTPLTEGNLFDTTDNLIQQGTTDQQAAAQVALTNAKGWYITLGGGEKVDGPSTTLSGATFFGTNTPADEDSRSCIGNLGIARTYAVSYLTAGAVIHLDGNLGDPLNVGDRSIIIPGGGFPPAPVALQVDVDGDSIQGVAFGPTIFQPAGQGFGRRYREWWYQGTDN